jgi:hypothetical protein
MSGYSGVAPTQKDGKKTRCGPKTKGLQAGRLGIC